MLNYLCIKMPKYVIDLSNDVIGATKRESGAELSQSWNAYKYVVDD